MSYLDGTDDTDQKNQDQKPNERPLDPSRNFADFTDPTGRTGVTQGGNLQSSAEPEKGPQDSSNMLGGVIENPQGGVQTGMTKDQTSDKAYNQEIPSQMSATAADHVSDLASEPSQNELQQPSQQPPAPSVDPNRGMGGDESLLPTQQPSGSVQPPAAPVPDNRNVTTEDAVNRQPENTGEQSIVGGTAPVTGEGKDIDEMNEEVGLSTDNMTYSDKTSDVEVGDKLDQAEEDEQAH